MQYAKKILLGLLLITSVTSWAQPSLDVILPTSAYSKTTASAKVRVDELIQSVADTRGTEHKLLHRIVRKAHSSFLKNYSPYSDFDQIFTEGTYDCLTGTAFFSYVLSKMNMEFEVIETNYHVFIMIHSSEGDALLETTDRLTGLVTDAKEIAERTEAYRMDGPPTVNPNQMAYRYECNLYRKVPVDKLPGLMLYNQAVKAYNRAEWTASARLLEMAYALYPTARCTELGDLLVRTIIAREVPEQIKRDCLSHLKTILLEGAGVVAAN